MNKSAASAASPDYIKFQAVIKSAASAASLRRGRASGKNTIKKEGEIVFLDNLYRNSYCLVGMLA